MKVIAIIKYTFLVTGICLLVGSLFLHQNTRSFISEALKA